MEMGRREGVGWGLLLWKVATVLSGGTRNLIEGGRILKEK